MIDLKTLKETDKGRWVKYNRPYCHQRGRIKSWNDRWIFVVYNCADEWDDYQDYTAAATEPNDLRFEIPRPGEEDIESRFEILDL